MISAREAMERAEAFGAEGSLEVARFWLDFARELREEAFQRGVFGWPEPIKAPRNETVVFQASVPEGNCRHCGYSVEHHEGVLVHSRTGVTICPAPSIVEWNARRAVIHAAAELG